MRADTVTKKALYILAIALLAALPCLGVLGAGGGALAAGGLGAAESRLMQRLYASQYPPGSYVEGEVVVVLEQPTAESLAELTGGFTALLEDGAGGSPSAFAASPTKEAVRLRLKPGLDELEAARKLLASPLVRSAEPNIVFRCAATNPNDPLYGEQWNLHGSYGVEANEAWDVQRGSSGLTLAVIDTGMDYNHPELLGRRNGGWDYYNGDADPKDDNGHGTMVAGMACANTNNSTGLAGLDWNARVMPLKALGANGEGYLDSVVNSIYHAANNGAKVINMSLTSSTYSQELADAVEFAHAMGCILVAAAGNEGDSRIDYPAGLTYVIGVGSIDENGSRSWFSNYNSSVDLAAPGQRIIGPKPNNSYDAGSGTSEATPHVSAAAMLVLAEYPGATPEQVWRRLKDSARDLGSPGYDESYGWGLLDANGALRVPLVTVTSPQDFTYPASGKVSASASSVNTTIRYLELWLDEGLIESHEFPVPGGSVNYTFGSWDLGQLTEGTHNVTVRAIDASGAWEGEHAITVYRNLSQPRPAQDWYLAEGTTGWGFEEYVLVQNPNAAPANVQVTFMKPGGSTQQYAYSMTGNSRLTILVNSLVATSDVSTYLHADLPVVAERAMYWGGRTGGHVAVGANAPDQDWYLAEGTTAWGFEEYVLVQNPNAAPANVQVTFMKPGGSTLGYGFSMPGNSRLTLAVNDLVASSDVSTHIHADLPVVAERAMYWGNRDGGHATLGVTEGCATWLLAEGSTAWGFEEYVLVQNPNTTTSSVTFTFLLPGGSQVRSVYAVGPLSRFTLNVAEIIPGSDVSTYVQADQPVIAERAMYWPRGSRSRAEGHCSTGSVTAADTWYLAEGTTAWGFDEYVLLVNPSEDIAHATLVFMRTDGSTLSHGVSIPGRARTTVHANLVDPERDASIQVISDRPVVVERAMYWSEKEGGTDALGVLQPL
ncbi:MAG: peptidase S8 [Actinobacteria bacterium]|nr:MAG: peptidase S8 [Actinomycetota bacterium]